MRVDDFDFELPEDRIALEPPENRDGARLLHAPPSGPFADRAIVDLPSLLGPGDILVLNDTRVIPAQLSGLRAARAQGGGGPVSVDVTLHKRLDTDDNSALWDAFVRPAKRLRVGDVIDFTQGGGGSVEAQAAFTADVMARDGGEARLKFSHGGPAFDAALARYGAPPLPPYIARKRALHADDAARYQTVYADRAGSVAAPTAGLHFTDDLLSAVTARGAAIARVTLHVGAGTFLPVAVDDTEDHRMHAEWGEITPETADAINAARRAGGRCVAVGTTALRLLESAARETGDIAPFCAETDIFITPGYGFRAVDCLLTNFHLPRSTLFMLVSAFSGAARMKDAYAHAIAAGYRFYSYGDACFLERARSGGR
ncbi:MAG: tRNA preQ1(34) S-adenosylmethionine ribosyltransferase-isomerase QueA [Pseudomonadota bacterium]